ncbi:MAG: Cys-tRNA(Pro) deacylase [Sphingomonas fennica]
MGQATPATQALLRAGIAFSVHAYDYDPAADRIGLAAAEALGEPPVHVLKTLMTLVDGRAVVAVLRSDATVAMKALAAAAGGRAAAMMPPADAERATGYKVGGISPLGQRRPAPVILDADAAALPFAYVNAGRRGLQVRLAPADLIRATQATVAAITA